MQRSLTRSLGKCGSDAPIIKNSIRPTALGKKNWLFLGDADAGQRSAILYAIIESCRCRGIDPYAYLRDVLTRLPSMTNWQVKHVTPEAWLGENFSLFNGNHSIARTITVRVAGYRIQRRNIRTMSIRRLA